MHASVGGKSSPLGALLKDGDQHILAITPTTDASIIAHEGTHIQDRVDNLKNRILEDLKHRFPAGDVGIEQVQLEILFQYISEQRAYAAQMKFLKENAVTPELIKTYRRKKADHLYVFRDRYITPIQGVIAEMKANDLGRWKFIKELVEKYSLPSEEVSPNLLFKKARSP